MGGRANVDETLNRPGRSTHATPSSTPTPGGANPHNRDTPLGIDGLVKRGYLKPHQRGDWGEIQFAVRAFLSDQLNAPDGSGLS